MKILEDMRADFENMTSWFRENILYCLKTIKETTDHSERNGWALEQFFQIFCLHPALLLSENPVVVIPRICLFSTASSRLILSPIILLWQILWFLKIFRELLMSCWLLKHTDPSLHLHHENVVRNWHYLNNICTTSEKWKDEKRLKVDWDKKDILPTI